MNVDNKKLRIYVVCGGVSSEREVSIESGKAVAYALTDYGYTDVSIFYLEENNLQKLIEQKPDLVYLALHGKGGEDGTIQGALDLAGIKYTGPGVAASAMCMDKILTKYVLKANNIPTAAFIAVNKFDFKSLDDIAQYILKAFNLPVVVKAPNQGSSIGVHIVKKSEDLLSAIEDVFNYGTNLLAEEYINGKEVTLPIIGNEELEFLPDVEIVSENEFYDFASKYSKGMSHHIIPSRISDECRQQMLAIGEKTYRTLGCKGISRIDFLVSDTRGPVVLEVNTSPGMTAMSLFPDAASRAGIVFGELVEKVIGLAMSDD